MGDLLSFPDLDPPLRQVEPDDARIVLVTLRAEEVKRPELVAVLKPFPTLINTYLYLSESDRIELAGFHRYNHDYLQGRDRGDCIRVLDWDRDAQKLARTCRWTYQVLDFFERYHQQQPPRPFTSSFIRRADEWGSGRTLMKNIRHNGSCLDDVVDIAAEARPEILDHYWSRQRAQEYREALAGSTRSR